MAHATEFTVTIADRPGALGKCFLALGERRIDVLAFQSYVEEGESLTRFVADDPAGTKALLGGGTMIFEQSEVAIVKLPNRPGQLGRAAARLGESKINISHSYCGIDPGSSQVLLVFGVDNLSRASAALDQLALETP